MELPCVWLAACLTDLDSNYLDLYSPITDIVVSSSFFLGTGTRLIAPATSSSSRSSHSAGDGGLQSVEDLGRVWGLTMVGNSLNHIEVVGNFNATDARASIGDTNIPTSGLGHTAQSRRGSQMTTVQRSLSTGLYASRQRFTFNFSDPGDDHGEDTLLLPHVSYLQYSVVYLGGGTARADHSVQSEGDGTGPTVDIVFDRAVTATLHVEARCCTGRR